MGFSISTVDIFILICFIPAVIGGLFNGLVRQIASLAALLLGIWAGWHFSETLSQGIRLWFKTENSIINIISFAIIFIIVLILVNFIGKGLSRIIRFALLGWLDKLLGVVFGIIKYSLILSVIIYFVTSLDALYSIIPAHHFAESKLYPIIESIAPAVFPYLENVKIF
ncbi:MAG: CvpA family protein [Bacteroidales bacterium]